MSGNVEIFHGKDVLLDYAEFMLMESNILYLDKDKPVLIKVNMLRDDDSNSITTDIRVAKILVEILSINGFNVIVGDGGEACFDTMKSFVNRGYDLMCEEFGAKLIDLNRGPMVPKVIGGNNMFINKYALESQVISVAKLKPHGMFGVTATLKNLMGCVLPKGHMHSNFTKKIADVYNYIKPVYGIVDGVIANGRCENIPCPIRMDTILVGDNLPYIDRIASEIIGKQAEHIQTMWKSTMPKEVVFPNFKQLIELAKLYKEGGIK